MAGHLELHVSVQREELRREWLQDECRGQESPGREKESNPLPDYTRSPGKDPYDILSLVNAYLQASERRHAKKTFNLKPA
jgi:hypothetical protein